MSKNKITIFLMGGIGNQLFQYAFGRSLSLKLNSKLYFVYDFLKDEQKLSKENIIKKKNEIKPYLNRINLLDTLDLKIDGENKIIKLLLLIERCIYFIIKKIKVQKYYINFNFFKIYRESSLSFNANLIDNINKKKNYYFEGYWQSYKYFEENNKLIFEELLPNKSKQKIFLDMHNIIQKQNVVAICVRTYFEVPGRDKSKKIDEKHMGGIATIKYYKNAIEKINKQIKNPTYFVFSDKSYDFLKDITGDYKNTHFINNDTGFRGTLDNLWLMSECKYQIISFSSFYWWAAWFSSFKFKDGMIIRPEEKFNTMEREDYYLKSWVKVIY